MLLINPAYSELIREGGLDQFERMMNWADGQPLSWHAKRDAKFIRVESSGTTAELLLKREWRSYLKDRVEGLLTGYGWGVKGLREWHVLMAMQRAGLPTSQPVLFAQRGLLQPRGYLLIIKLPGAVQLTEYLRWNRPRLTVAERRELARRIGEAVARLHNAGINHPDLFAKHVLLVPAEVTGGNFCGTSGSGQLERQAVTLKPAELAVTFVDLQRSSVGRHLSWRARCRDLAALAATTSAAMASQADRLACLRAYLAAARAAVAARRAVRLIRRRANRLLQRRKIAEMRCESDQPRRDQFVCIDAGRLCVNRNWLDVLRQAGLGSLQQLMHVGTGQTIRQLSDRANVLLQLPAHSGVVRAYLKRHRGRYPFKWLSRLLTGHQPRLPGPREAEMIERLKRIDVPTPELIAFGSEFGPGPEARSVLVTRGVPDAVQLDYLLEAIDRSAADWRTKRQRIRRLILQVAELARRFHRAGYNHRDFYLCHFLARPPQSRPGKSQDATKPPPDAAELASEPAFELVLIDLQRVQYRPPFRLRWLVKDLAQLNYSAPAAIVTRTDRLRFFKSYLGVDRLSWYHRWLVRWIAFKTKRIGRHDRRRQQRHRRDPAQRAA